MILVQEVVNGKQRIGFAVAIGKGEIGYSLCHPTLDTFRYGRGVEIAVGRARKGINWKLRMEHLAGIFNKQARWDDSEKIEEIMIPALAAMQVKSKRFFRNSK